MSKPSTARTEAKPPEKPYDAAPAKRVRAIKTGHNEYTLVEETFASPPTSVRVLKEKSDGGGAVYRCRLWIEEHIGTNRLGGTGLE